MPRPAACSIASRGAAPVSITMRVRGAAAKIREAAASPVPSGRW
jgi:hypothetical protein